MTRQNFFQGQCVAPEHLNALQDYADSGQTNLISGLLGYGVVSGFEVSAVEGYVVEVTSGLAFNLAGERLILDDSKQVDLSQYAPSSGTRVIKLGVVVDYEKSDAIVDGYGDTVHTKWTPTVQFIMGETLDSGVFELAEITIGSTSITSITNTSENFITLQKLVQNTAMEIGTNDNGTYIKFENGVLICIGATTTSTSSGYVYRLYRKSFPYKFATLLTQFFGTITRSVNNTTLLIPIPETTDIENTSSWTLAGLTVNWDFSTMVSSDTFQINGVAIGFWK